MLYEAEKYTKFLEAQIEALKCMPGYDDYGWCLVSAKQIELGFTLKTLF